MRIGHAAAVLAFVALPAVAQTPCQASRADDRHAAGAQMAARDQAHDARQDSRDARRDAAAGDYAGAAQEQHDAGMEQHDARADSHAANRDARAADSTGCD
jgi:hypothetical protein